MKIVYVGLPLAQHTGEEAAIPNPFTLSDPADLSLPSLRAAYADGAVSPTAVARAVCAAADRADPAIWIARASTDALLAQAAALEAEGPADKPLWGAPFAVKDNIDVAGWPTTVGCPDFAFEAETDATVVRRLLDAGALLVGKTNLDQFATGLVGERSPYSAPGNAFDAATIPGGSSSGSAVAVAAGLVSFALGTDTAGSGRVPAAFNNLIGLKPTRGLIPIRGVFPACASLDCVSIFAMTAADAGDVLGVCAGFDPADPWSRAAGAPHAIPPGATLAAPRADQLAFFGDDERAALFDQAIKRLEALGHRVLRVDISAFLEAARLLYEGPWVAERWTAFGQMIAERADSVDPAVRAVVGRAPSLTAVEAFSAMHALQALRRRANALWADAAALVTPTAGTIYTKAALAADPVTLNANLGYYTNFLNLLDYAGVAAPVGFDSRGLPFGVTFAAPAFADHDLLALAGRFHHACATPHGAGTRPAPAPRPSGPAPGRMRIAVCGAHLSGEPLNHQLTARGGALIREAMTAPVYRMLKVGGAPVPRPGLLRVPTGGAALPVEVWEIDAAEVGSFLAGIAAPLGLGRTALADGGEETGFVCEADPGPDAIDITEYGGWRAWRASAVNTPPKREGIGT